MSVLSKVSVNEWVKYVLKNFMATNKEFSALNVTQEVRKCVGNVHSVVHSDVRAAVHEQMKNAVGYEKTDNGTYFLYVYKPKPTFAASLAKAAPKVFRSTFLDEI